MENSKLNNTQSYHLSGMITLVLRLVVGWTYFSAFWRRVVLENKLDPDAAGYIGEKFNHFLPNALGIKPMIEYLVSNPDALWMAMLVFTIVEAIVGLLLMFGFFTRLMSIGVFFLAMGILLGSGWIGTTCLDEWQIGVLGVSSGFLMFLSGSSKYSLDGYFMSKGMKFTQTNWFAWLGSGELPMQMKKVSRIVLIGSFGILGLTLFTNQYFHGGVFGTLHNMSVKPIVEITDAKIKNQNLDFTIMRVEGADVYGSFLIGIKLTDSEGNEIITMDGKALSEFNKAKIDNYYVAKIKPGKHSLIIPLGAKANMSIPLETVDVEKGKTYRLTLIDISGTEWTETVSVL